MTIIKRAWRGEERLAKVWWVIGVPLNIALAAFDRGAVTGAFGPSADPSSDPATALFIVLGTSFAVWGGWAYAAWRCASNVDRPIWSWVARGLLIVNFAYGLIILGATAQQLHDAWKLRVPQTDPTQLQFAQVPQGSQSNQTVETTLRSAASPQPDALALTTVPSVDGKSSATVYLDSRWRAITPPSNARPGVKYLEYEGLHEVAIFDFTQTNQTPEQVSLDTIASLSGFAVGAKPFSAELSGHTVWFADMTGKVRGLSQYLRLYVFRNASGKMWQILMVSAYPVDQRFNERADAFARAVATSD